MEGNASGLSLARARSGRAWWRSALAYLELTKPLSVALLVFTGVGGLFVGSGGRPDGRSLVLLLLAGTAGASAANVITCYIDRDMDAIMVRTRRRPLPTGRVAPPSRALLFGLVLMALSLLLAALQGPLCLALMALGLFDNIVVYSLLAKRRNRLSVLWGGLSGGVPVAYGWAAATGTLGLTPLLMASLVVLWIPNHIWNLALYHAEDYRKVGVPMLPVVSELSKAVRCIASTVALMFAASLAIHFAGGFGAVYLAAAVVLGLALLAGNTYLALRPSRPLAWVLFKLSSPYLLLLFVAMMADVAIR